MEPVSDWSTLIHEMLVEIAKRIPVVADFMAFRGICASWRAAATKDKFVHSLRRVPFLMLAEKGGSDEREFYSLSRRKIAMRLPLPEIKGKKCMEAGFGWFLTVSNSGEVRRLDMDRGLSKHSLLLVGYGKFYAISASGGVCVWDESSPFVKVVNETSKVCDGSSDKTRVARSAQTEDPVLHELEAYLVESSSGDLLVIIRDRIECVEDWDYGVTNFKVVRLDLTKCEWEEISNLDMDAIFVGHSTATSIVASAFPDVIKANCIYFTGDCFESYTFYDRHGRG
ncbi:OLC1v1029894C1 [Oldenlandia corymbosa var. corymbosa]|uniref:OLC1v1029894C1 n=1 Tax=Oldenlandia corymbosa var. corymbosa TaxID=529605 RepID=A0AAV1CGU8_OLDCO|nr:OLC1v1029894C1 [Oldenlandia corymbosa var. corymbosa]